MRHALRLLPLLLACTAHRPAEVPDIAASTTPAASGDAPPEVSSEPSASGAALPEVRTDGTLRAVMHEGRTDAQVSLAEVVPGPHTYAVGALSGLRGEVTIVDDAVWLALPDGHGGVRLQRDLPAGEGAALLVSARVPKWQRVVLEADLAPEALETGLEQLAARHGVDTSRPFPLRIEGRASELAWHVLDGKAAHGTDAALRGEVRDAEALMVGFFSRQHAGVFTHRGQATHLHAVLEAQGVSGHVDRVGLRAGSVVLLPQ